MSEMTPDPVLDRLAGFSPDSSGIDPAEVLFRAGRATARTPRVWKIAVVGLVMTNVVTLGLFIAQGPTPGPTPEVVPTPVVPPVVVPQPERLPQSSPTPWSYGAMMGVTDLDQVPPPASAVQFTPDGPALTPLSIRDRIVD